MTISTTDNRKEYAGNDVVTSFPYPYKFFADSDLVVELVDTATNTSVLQTLTSDYTVIGAGLDAGGSVEMIVEPATGEQLVIYWDGDATQLTDYVENDSFPAESHEDALDKLTRLVQRIQDRLDRSVVLSDSDTSGVDLTIPEAALLDRALQFLQFDAAGNLTTGAVVGDIGSFVVSAANIVGAIVQRDGNGDFAANEITAALVIAALTGNVTGNVTGDLTGNVNGNPALDATTAQSGFVELATAAEITAGTAKKVVDAAQLKVVQDSVALTKSYASAAQTITSSGQLVLAHGLGVEPGVIQYVLQCTTAESGYSIGDRVGVDLNTSTSVGDKSNTPLIDATNITVQFTDATSAFTVTTKGGGARADLTNGSWQLYVKAWG